MLLDVVNEINRRSTAEFIAAVADEQEQSLVVTEDAVLLDVKQADNTVVTSHTSVFGLGIGSGFLNKAFLVLLFNAWQNIQQANISRIN